MRKITVILVALFVLAGICPVASALSVGPIEPVGHLKWAVSVEDNYTIDRKLETSGTFTEAKSKGVNQAYGKITLGLTDYFNVYAKLGSTTQSKYRFVDSGTTTYDYETKTSFVWGIGASGIYKLADTWKLIGDIQYNAWNEDVDKAAYNGTAGSNITNPRIENKELQLTGLLSKDFDLENETIFTPYLGVGYVIYRTKSKDVGVTFTASGTPRGTIWDVNAKDVIVGVGGLKVKVYKNWQAFVEGRFIAENAVSGGLTYNF